MAHTGRSLDTHSTRGFTLLEVLVATGLLATAVVSLLHLFAISARANLDARDTTYGTVLAAQKLEELRGATFPEHTPVEGEDALDLHAEPVDASTSPPAYRRRWLIAPLPADPLRSVVITVTVSRGEAFDHRAVQLTTIRTRRQ